MKHVEFSSCVSVLKHCFCVLKWANPKTAPLSSAPEASLSCWEAGEKEKEISQG